jgi:hypothetical protein
MEQCMAKSCWRNGDEPIRRAGKPWDSRQSSMKLGTSLPKEKIGLNTSIFEVYGVVKNLRQQLRNYFELLSLYSERSVCTYATDRVEGKQPKETGNVNLNF